MSKPMRRLSVRLKKKFRSESTSEVDLIPSMPSFEARLREDVSKRALELSQTYNRNDSFLSEDEPLDLAAATMSTARKTLSSTSSSSTSTTTTKRMSRFREEFGDLAVLDVLEQVSRFYSHRPERKLRSRSDAVCLRNSSPSRLTPSYTHTNHPQSNQNMRSFVYRRHHHQAAAPSSGSPSSACTGVALFGGPLRGGPPAFGGGGNPLPLLFGA
jgi:hypothetical protein